MTAMTTETPDTYNGWTNRETWAVALYINNDQGWQESVYEALRAADVEQWNEQPAGGLAAYRAGEIIRENVEGLLNPTQYRDEYGDHQPESLVEALYDIGSLYRVNWDEIGGNFLTALAEESGE